MRKLETTFTRKGIDYEMMDRSDKVGLFKLSLDGIHVGYEVAKIYHNEARTISGIDIEEGESIPSDEMFGGDGSKAFFPNDGERALKYFYEFTTELELKELSRMV
jgi:hypothetical protein